MKLECPIMKPKRKKQLQKKKGNFTFTSLAEETQFDNDNQVKPISENDFPLEWIAFVRLGPPALGNCHDISKYQFQMVLPKTILIWFLLLPPNNHQHQQ